MEKGEAGKLLGRLGRIADRIATLIGGPGYDEPGVTVTSTTWGSEPVPHELYLTPDEVKAAFASMDDPTVVNRARAGLLSLTSLHRSPSSKLWRRDIISW